MTDSYLEKYNPKTPLFERFEIDRSLSQNDQAFATWRVLLEAKRNHDGLFLVIGKLLKEVRDQKFYKHMDYETFGQFLESEELSFSREKAYMCIKVYEYYIEYLELDPSSIDTLNISRLSMMVPLLKQISDKTEAVKRIEEMSSLRHGDFVREVREKSNRDGKPAIYWSEELSKWIVTYYHNTTHLNDLREFTPTIVVQ